MKKNPILTEQTRQNLIDAFWEMYSNKRIEKITIKEITTKAGYNRSTFYEYFTDVYDLLDQVESQLITKLQELPLRQLSSEGVAFPLETLVTMYADYSKYFVVLLGDHGDPSFQRKIKESFKPMIKEKLLEQGAPEGFELDYSLEYALSAMIGILGYWFRQGQTPEIEKLMVLINQLSSEGIMNVLKPGKPTDINL
jgi:AcrR family transcriptional regulator